MRCTGLCTQLRLSTRKDAGKGDWGKRVIGKWAKAFEVATSSPLFPSSPVTTFPLYSLPLFPCHPFPLFRLVLFNVVSMNPRTRLRAVASLEEDIVFVF